MWLQYDVDPFFQDRSILDVLMKGSGPGILECGMKNRIQKSEENEHRTFNVQHRMLNEKEKRTTKDEQSSDE